MKSLALLLALLTVTARADLPAQLDWDVDVASPLEYEITLSQGEAVTLAPRYLYRDVPVAIAATATVRLYFRTYGTTGTPSYVAGSVASDDGTVHITMPSDLALAVGQYAYWVAVSTNTTVNMRARGVMTVLDGYGNGTVPAATVEPMTGAIVTNIVNGIVSTHNAATNSHADIRALATNVTDTAARSGILSLSNTVTGVNSTATNALAQAASALAVAISKASPADATNIVASWVAEWAPTGTVGHATAAGGIDIDNGDIRFTLMGDTFTVIKTTNTASVIVTETSGEGYNGPPVGTTWVNPTELPEGIWNWPDPLGGIDWPMQTFGASILESDSPIIGVFSVRSFIAAGALPIMAGANSDGGDSIGALYVNWVTHTTTNSYNLASFLTSIDAPGSSTTNLLFWTGTTNAFQALSVTNPGTVYFIR